jgi:tripartite-type tricarboxylate transporter receptor subunit TctC
LVTLVGVVKAWHLLSACALAGAAHAQTWPARAVRFIVPVAPGGATDILARTLSQRLAPVWAQQAIVDNRPGGGSNVGFEAAAQAAPDGHTLLLAQPPFAINKSLYRKLAFDPIRDFAAITLAASGANAMVVHPAVPARTLKEFIALARTRPGALNYASSGNGTTPHLSGELFKRMARIDLVHVPYKGAALSITDLIGGHVDLAFVSLSSVVTFLHAGRLRAIGVTSARRSALVPDIPTFIEGGLPGFEVTGWYGVVAPTGTPREVIQRVHGDVTRVLAEPSTVRSLAAAGLETAAPNSPEEFAAFLKAEIVKWGAVVKASGARAD